MTKQTPIQLLEERVKLLESGAKYSDWFVGHWYKTFESPLRDDVNALKIKLSKSESDAYLDKLKAEQAKDKPNDAIVKVYWLSCFACLLIGIALTLAALRFAGMLK